MNKKMNIGKVIGHILVAVLTVVVMAAGIGIAFMFLWNWLVPDIFGLKELSYLESIGLLVLTQLVFWRMPHKHNDEGDHEHHLHHHFGKENKENREYEEMYEKWWSEKGANDMDAYMKQFKSSKK